MLIIHDFDPPTPKAFSLVISGMRNSWESWEKGDSVFFPADLESAEFVFGEADKALAVKLIKAGTDHGKFLRQLPIVVDFTAPESFLKQFDTYKIGTTRNSTSTMHTLGKNEITPDMFSFEDTDAEDQYLMVAHLNDLRSRWVAAGKRKGPSQTEWRALINALPMGFLFRSCWSANYQVLRNIYHARKHHRLDEWHTFCSFIQELPLAELITVEK